jgi:hypothetical protein
MSGLEVLQRTSALGIELSLDGCDLLLKADAQPPTDFVKHLVRHKWELVSLLRQLQNGQSNGDQREDFDRRSGGSGHGTTRILPGQLPHWPSLDVHDRGLLKTSPHRDSGNQNQKEAPSLLAHELNPNLPWPQPGETVLPGWGNQVSMEYRLRTASEDECLEWAKEPWQVELVAKAHGYSTNWVDQILFNRKMWNEAFAARDSVRTQSFEHPHLD